MEGGGGYTYLKHRAGGGVNLLGKGLVHAIGTKSQLPAGRWLNLNHLAVRAL